VTRLNEKMTIKELTRARRIPPFLFRLRAIKIKPPMIFSVTIRINVPPTPNQWIRKNPVMRDPKIAPMVLRK
jgi:hypothetical protein